MSRQKARKPRQEKLRTSVVIGLNPAARGLVVEVGVLPGLSGLPDIEYPLGLSPAEALGLVQSERVHVTMHQSMLAGAVAAARSSGCSWAAIAEVLGVSRQSAHERYAAMIDQTADDDLEVVDE